MELEAFPADVRAIVDQCKIFFANRRFSPAENGNQSAAGRRAGAINPDGL